MPETPEQIVRTALIRRLVDRHGLDEQAAATAVDRARAGEDTPHAALIDAEARAVIAEAMRPFIEHVTEMWRAIEPALRGLAQQFAALAEQPRRADEYVLAPPPARDRPAWQSPYGPPKRHR